METEKRRRIIEKLIKLSEQGIGGEKDNAVSLLDAILKKYDLNIEDFKEDSKRKYRLFYLGAYEKDLMFDILRQVLNKNTISYIKVYRARNYIDINLTVFEKSEYDYLTKAYREEMRKHLDAAALAFRHKNDIGADDPDDGFDERPPTKKEMDLWARAFGINVKQVSIHKSIEGKVEEEEPNVT